MNNLSTLVICYPQRKPEWKKALKTVPGNWHILTKFEVRHMHGRTYDNLIIDSLYIMDSVVDLLEPLIEKANKVKVLDCVYAGHHRAAYERLLSMLHANDKLAA